MGPVSGQGPPPLAALVTSLTARWLYSGHGTRDDPDPALPGPGGGRDGRRGRPRALRVEGPRGMSGVMWSADQHGQVMALLHRIDYRIGLLMNAQADVDNATALLLQIAQQILSIVTELKNDLAGQDVDTSKLVAAEPSLQSAVDALQQLADASAPTTGGTGTTTSSGTGTTTAPGTSTTGTTTTTGTGTTTTV